jgi:deazaflavin-dependent oxidoreductase (nitroreductase family)
MNEHDARTDRQPEAQEHPRDPPLTPFQERLGRVAVQWMAAVNIAALRLGHGRVASRVPGGAPICILTTTGRRTGRCRTVPLLYLPLRGDQLVVVASRGGTSTHPAWYLNLRADSRATVEVGETRWEMVARDATAAERAELWPKLTTVYPRFDTYQRRTARLIPVVILRPSSPTSPPTAGRPGPMPPPMPPGG